MLFHARLDASSQDYFEQLDCVLTGVLDVGAMEKAWAGVIARYDALRTVFAWKNMDKPRQVVLRTMPVPLFHHDWREESAQAIPERLRLFLEADRRQGFQLNKAPLMRIHLIRLSQEKWHFVWSHHHILLDGWSVARVMAEVFTGYQLARMGVHPSLPPAGSFKNYINWLGKQDLNHSKNYWKQYLAGFYVPTPLPRSGVEKGIGKERMMYEASLPQELAAALGEMARDQATTVNTLIQAAWALLLARYAAEDEVVFGAVVSGRPADLDGVESMVGLFINTLPIRVNIPPGDSFRTLIERMRMMGVEHDQYAYTPLVEIQSWSEIPRGANLFQTLLIFENYPVSQALEQEGLDPGIQISQVSRHEQTNYPLTLVCAPHARGYHFQFSYDVNRFQQRTLARIFGHLHALLARLSSQPDQPLARLSILNEKELEVLFHQWNGQPVDDPENLPVYPLFERHARQNPHGTALILNEEQLTYGELKRKSDQLAAYLVEQGLLPDQVVGLCMVPCFELVISMLALFKVGAAYMPMEPGYPDERVAFMLQDASAAMVLCLSVCLPRFKDKGLPFFILDDEQTWQKIQAASLPAPTRPADPDNLAYIIYTSGSVGKPKGVMISHRSLANQLFWRRSTWPLNSQDRVLNNISFCFDPSVWQILWPLVSGAGLVLLAEGVNKDSAYMARLIEKEKITVTAMVPSFLKVLLEEPAFCRSSHLRHISCGGEAVNQDLQKLFIERTGLDNVLQIVYGPTEATIDTTSMPVCREHEHDLVDGANVVHIGRPITNSAVFIVDRNHNLLPARVPGELLIAGVELARGYLGRPALTAQSFIPNLFATKHEAGSRLYRSGDLVAWLPDGRIEFLGRIDLQVKVRGFRIELGEIENVISGDRLVVEKCVVAREIRAGGGRELIAFIQTTTNRPDLKTIEADLRARIVQSLPAQFEPARFVFMDRLPLTANGKIDRRRLEQMPLEFEDQGSELVAPRNPTEELLATIWCDILGLSEVSIESDFFQLGGHSLMATRVISRACASFGLDLPLRLLFEAPTIRALAARISFLRTGQETRTAIRPQVPGMIMPLSFSQQRMWFFDRMEGPSATYNMPIALVLQGNLDRAALQQAMAEIVRRHHILRAFFPESEGKAVQHLLPETALGVRILELEGLDAATAEVRARQTAAAEAGFLFDLKTGPLLRTTLIGMAPDRHILVLNMHHIISDGWSMGVLVTELTQLYRAFSCQKPSPLPELPIQYGDYVIWQRNFLHSAALEKRLAFWRKTLAGANSFLALPTDRPRPAVRSFNGAELFFQLDADRVKALRQLSSTNQSTLFMTTLAAWFILLSRYSNQDDLLVGTPVANRNRAEVEPLIGLFINTLVLRGDMTDNPDFKEFLARIKNHTLEVFEQQDTPFEQVVDAIEPERDLARSPLFQAFFAFQNTPAGNAFELPGLSLSPYPLADQSVARFDLTLELEERGDRLSGRLEYNTDLFDASTIQRLAGHYQNLLQVIVADPARPLKTYDLLDPSERDLLLKGWGQGEAFVAPRENLAERVAHLAGVQPQAAALRVGGETLDYANLNNRVNSLFCHPTLRGIGSGHRVGIHLRRDADLVVSILAVFRTGACLVYLDPEFPADRLDFMMADAAPDVVICKGQTGLSGQTLFLNLDHEPGQGISRSDEPTVMDNPAYLIYTSGTTGKPKAVQVTYGNLSHTLFGANQAFGFRAEDVMPCIAAFSFDISFFEMFAAILAGGTGILLDRDEILDMTRLTAVLRETSVFHAVPGLLEQVVRHNITGAEKPFDGVRMVFTGGDRVPPKLLVDLKQIFPNALIRVLYGPTEASIICTAYEVPDQVPATHVIGQPLPGDHIRIVDSATEPAPMGAPGELWIGGPGVTAGYLGQPLLTAEKYPEKDGLRFYRSGDLARWKPDPAGDRAVLEFLGRIDHQVKIRGFRVEPGEIQAQLETHERVDSAVVLPRNDHQGRLRLVAYLTGTPDTALLRGYLAERLPEYMIPSLFLTLETMPLTPNGKVDRRALLALPLPEQTQARLVSHAPSNPVEEALAEIWASVLGVARIGIHDNFFELGGDSIQSIQIVARANRQGLGITPRLLFQHQTIAALAKVAGFNCIEAEQGMVTGPCPLTPIQARFFEQNHPEPNHYNQTLLFDLKTPLAPDLIATALKALCRHHDAMRLTFELTPEGMQARFGDETCCAGLEVYDLSQEADAAPVLEQTCADIQAGLDLKKGPTARFAYFAMPQNQARLLLVVHHLLVDAVSWRMVLEDLQQACGALLQNRPIELPPKTSSWKAWAERLNEYARSDRMQAESDYWRGVSASATAVYQPAAKGPYSTADVAGHSLSLDRDLTTDLLLKVPAAFNTRINDALLTSVAAALQKLTGYSEHLVHLEAHGREHLFDDLDITRTMGWFTAIYPIRLRATDNLIADFKWTKEMLRAVPLNGIGYGLLRYLHPDNPIQSDAHIAFNYLGQLDGIVEEHDLIGPAPESAGRNVAASGVVAYPLEINCAVSGGELLIQLAFVRQCFDEARIKELGAAIRQGLIELIQQCSREGVGGYTPSDFPLARLEQRDLDLLAPAGGGIEDIYPLSPLQEGMLYHALLDPDSDPFANHLSCVLHGLDPECFKQAWAAVIQRHSVLRTGFTRKVGSRPLQLVFADAQPVWIEQDWRLPDINIPQKLEEFRHSQQCLIHVDQAPLMRFALFQVPNGHLFLWVHHHLIMDGWSLPIVFRDVFSHYLALQNKAPQGAAPPVSFREYIAWLVGQDRSAAEDFWRGELGDLEEPTPLPLEGTGSGGNLPLILKREEKLPKQHTRDLDLFARKHRLTLSTLTQGAWALLLCHYANKRDVVFGTTVSGRPPEIAGIEDMVGMLVNTLPARVRVDKDRQVLQWLNEIQDKQVLRETYASLALADLQKMSGVPHALGLFGTLLVLENYPVEDSVEDVNEQTGESLELSEFMVYERPVFPITATLSPGEELHLRFEWHENRIGSDLIGRVIDHFWSLLTGLIRDPHASLASISILTPEEQRRILNKWNQTGEAYASNRMLHELFEARVAEAPDALALEVLSEGRKLSYAELDRLSNRLAHYLRAVGVTPDRPVGLYTHRNLEMVVGMLGILKAGGAYLPMDPDFPPDRLAWMVQNSGLEVIVTQPGIAAQLPPHEARLVSLDSDGNLIAPEFPIPEGPLALPLRGGSLLSAYIIYTSGSTGRPKGVMLSHRNVVNFLLSMGARLNFGREERMLALTTMSFDISVLEIFLPLVSGAPILLAGRDAAMDPHLLIPYLNESHVTFLQGTPSTWRMLVDAGWQGNPAITGISGGEAMPPNLARQLLNSVSRLWHVYGPTETTIWSSAVPLSAAACQGANLSIGGPLGNQTIHLLDQGLNVQPMGVPGRLMIGGDGLARGYLSLPAMTAEKFTPDPFSDVPGSRLYHTGDLARRLEDTEAETHRTEFLGRLDFQVKIRGYRIELGEVVAVLERCDGVSAAVVRALPDAAGQQRLVAYVVGSGNADQLREAMSSTLPGYMVPTLFVFLETFPLTPNGKIDILNLPKPGVIASHSTAYVPPGNQVETQLCEIWQETLGVPRVGIRDDFFQLGGHSLLAVRLMAAVSRRFELELPLSLLLQGPTVSQMAAVLLDKTAARDGSPLVPIKTGGRDLPLFLTHPAGGNVLAYTELARLLPSSVPVYGLQSPPLYGGEVMEDVSQIAACYVKAIRTIQPAGPYQLGGWSLGCVFAFAMAQHLRAEGEEVRLLALFDGYGPESMPAMEDEAHLMTALVNQEMAGFGVHLDASILREGGQANLLQSLESWLRRFHPEVFEVITPLQLQRLWLAGRANILSSLNYKLMPYDGHIHFFKALVSKPDRRGPEEEWQACASGGLTLIDTPGDHDSLIQLPHVATLVANLEALLLSDRNGSFPEPQNTHALDGSKSGT